MTVWLQSLAILALATGCSFDALQIEGRMCPCGPGSVCDDVTKTCHFVRLDATDGGGDSRPGRDGSRDAAPDRASFDVPSENLDSGADVVGADVSTPDVGMDTPTAITTRCGMGLFAAAICDGFEDGFSSDWTTTGGDIRADPDAFGDSVVVFDADSVPDTRGSLRVRPGPFSAGETVHVHALVRLELSGMPGASVPLFSTRGPTIGDGIDLYAGPVRAGIRIQREGARAVDMDATQRLPLGEWFCLRGEVLLSAGATGSVRMFLNDELIASASNIRTGTGADSFFLGPAYTGGTITAEVRMDEVVVGPSSIPCAISY